MTQIKGKETSIISAATQKVYSILADYQNEHPKILPEQYFSDYKVVQGGIEAGTIIEFRTHVLGQSRSVMAEINEPEPGRMLAEKDMATGLVTTFIVEPINSGQKTSVTMETNYQKSGVMRSLNALRPLYCCTAFITKSYKILKNMSGAQRNQK